MSDPYKDLGVDSAKKAVHQAIARENKGAYPGAFCKIFTGDLIDQYEVMHNDGDGTKTKLYYLLWAEKNKVDTSIWFGAGQDLIAMNLDDMGCVGVIDRFRLTDTIDRHPARVGGEVFGAILEGIHQQIAMLDNYGIGCRLYGGETADVGDICPTISLNGAAFATLNRRDIINAERMEEGDVLIGFSSTGQSVYEATPNSGIAANGLTGAGHFLLSHYYKEKYPETWDFPPPMNPEDAYCGKFRLEDALPGDPKMTIGEALTSPTRIYLPLIKELVRRIGAKNIHALIHCTGGAQTKIGKFGKSDLQYVKDNLFPLPPIMAAVQSANPGRWSNKAILKTFNGGHLIEAAVRPEFADQCIASGKLFNIDAQRIGVVRKLTASGSRVVIDDGSFGTVEYSAEEL